MCSFYLFHDVLAVKAEPAGLPPSGGDIEGMLSTISRNFVKYMLALLSELRKVSVDEFERCMSSMVARLDYNYYYSKQEAQMTLQQSSASMSSASLSSSSFGPVSSGGIASTGI